MATATIQLINMPLTCLSVKSVAEFLSCSEDHVRALIAKRELPASRVGNRILIKRTDVEDLLVRNRI